MKKGYAEALVLLLAVAATIWWTVRDRDDAGDDKRRANYEGARLGTAGDAIPVLRLAGSPEVKGRAHGEALAPRIRAWLDRLRPSDPGVAAFAIETCAVRMLPQLPAHVRAELEGIAAGANVTVPEILFLNTQFELAAFNLVGDRGPGFFGRAGVGASGPEVVRHFTPAEAEDLLLIVHEDTDPPLVLVARPGMVGGFLGLRGATAGALRPMQVSAGRFLSGLVWPVLLRSVLESKTAPPAGPLGMKPNLAASLPLALPDGSVGTLNLSVEGGSWYAAPRDGFAMATEEPVDGRDGLVVAGRRSASARALHGERARRFLSEAPPPDVVAVRLKGSRNGFSVSLGRRRGVVRYWAE